MKFDDDYSIHKCTTIKHKYCANYAPVDDENNSKCKWFSDWSTHDEDYEDDEDDEDADKYSYFDGYSDKCSYLEERVKHLQALVDKLTLEN